MGNNSCSWLEWIRALAPIGTWGILVLGWIVGNRYANQREKRKEIRLQLDGYWERIDDLECLAIKYHTTELTDNELKTLSRKIVSAISRNYTMINRLHLDPADEEQAIILHVDLKKAITLNNFDSADHAILPVDNELLEEISNACTEITNFLEYSFIEKYTK
jgi:hypothetical protein